MPDSPICYPDWWFSDWWREWLSHGKFVPGDVRIFFGSPYFWQELNYAIPLYISGLAVAYFLRGRGVSLASSYGAGLLLAFCGYWCTLFSAGHGSWFILMTYVIFPFGLLDRAIRKDKLKNWLLLGATIGWAGYWQPDLWLLFLLLIGVYFVYRCVCQRRFPWKGMMLAAVAMFAVGSAGFYGAVFRDLGSRDKQIAESRGTSLAGGAAAATNDDERWVFVTNWSLPPDETAEFFVPRINGDTSCPMTLSLGVQHGTGVRPYTGALGRPMGAVQGNYRQHSLYVGWVTCLLALVGLLSFFWRRGDGARPWRKDILFFAIAAAVCWLFSLGRYCEPVYRMIFSLPFGDYLRAPVKWHHLTEFSLVVLAGFGLELVFSLICRAGRNCCCATLAVAGIVLLGAWDLARVDRLYCAPVDLREARRQKASLQMTFLRQSDFSNPQVSALVKAKRIVPLANPRPDVYLVGVLEPYKREDKSLPPLSFPAGLSILAMIATVGIGVYAGLDACGHVRSGRFLACR